MRTYSAVYTVPIPTTNTNPYSVQFKSRIKGNVYTFTFKWINSAWALFVTFPDSTVRNASTVPGVLSWSAYPDYGLMIVSDTTPLGQNDLSTVTIYWLVW